MATGAWKPVEEDNASAWKPVDEAPPAKPGLLDTIKSNWASNTEPQDTGSPISDAIHNIGGRAAKSFLQPVLHPIDTAVGLGKLVSQNPWEAATQMSQGYAQGGHPLEDAAGDAIAGVLQGGVLGAGGAGAGKLLDLVPSRARAGQVFESVMNDAADQPVTLSRSMEPMERAQQLSARGHGNIGAVDKLYNRVNTVNPLNYREARDYASALSNITGGDKMNATKSLMSQGKQLSHAFNEDVGDAASAVGRGEDYARAMKEYAQASQLRDFAGKAAKYAIPVAAGAAGLPILGRILGKLTQ